MKIRSQDWDHFGEIEKIKEYIEDNGSSKDVTLVSFLKEKKIQPKIYLMYLLCVGQHFTGVVSVIYFANGFIASDYYQKVKLDVIVSILMFWAFFWSACFAVLNHKISNKLLILFGYFMMFLSCFLGFLASLKFDTPFVFLIFIFSLFLFFQSGAGSLPWVIFRQIFELKYQPASHFVFATVNWSFNLFVTFMSFPVLKFLFMNSLILFGLTNLTLGIVILLWMEDNV